MKKKFKFNIKIIPEIFFEIMWYSCEFCIISSIALYIIAEILNNSLLVMITHIILSIGLVLYFISTVCSQFFMKKDGSASWKQFEWVKKDKLKPPDEYDIEFKSITSVKKEVNEISKKKGYLLFTDPIKYDKYEVNIYVKKSSLLCYDVLVVWYADVLNNESIIEELEKKIDGCLKKIFRSLSTVRLIDIFCVKEKSPIFESNLFEFLAPRRGLIRAYIGIDIKNKKLYLCKNNFNAYLYKKIKKELDKEKNNDN